VANHVPLNARIIGANEHESHYVFDLLYNNTTDIQPSIHSTDTHGTNEVNFAILAFFGYWELDNLRRSLHLLNYVDSPQFQRNIQRALNRGESYHKLVRAVAYANGGKLRVRTDQEQQLWSECSRLLANCIIYYNACILSELLERAERRQDYQRADAIKRANPASWKHVNLYGAYSFLDIGDGVDLQELVNLLEAARGRGTAAPD
jgi:TnpA family transposase